MKYQPMLAAPMKAGVVTRWTDWVAEQKYDGHRLIVYVNQDYDVQAYARPRGDGRMIERKLHPKLAGALANLASGVYDGELVAPKGFVSTDVSRLDLADQLCFVAFDVLATGGVDVTWLPYVERRKLLETAMRKILTLTQAPIRVRLAEVHPVVSELDLVRVTKRIWDQGGEGVIIKRKDAPYTWEGSDRERRRSGAWIKVKREFHDALTVVGFAATKGTVMNRGAFAMVLLKDDEGNTASCKTLDDHELARLEAAGHGKPVHEHPWIGRKLMINHYGRTASGGYRGPVRWDRWEDE